MWHQPYWPYDPRSHPYHLVATPPSAPPPLYWVQSPPSPDLAPGHYLAYPNNLNSSAYKPLASPPPALKGGKENNVPFPMPKSILKSPPKPEPPVKDPPLSFRSDGSGKPVRRAEAPVPQDTWKEENESEPQGWFWALTTNNTFVRVSSTPANARSVLPLMLPPPPHTSTGMQMVRFEPPRELLKEVEKTSVSTGHPHAARKPNVKLAVAPTALGHVGPCVACRYVGRIYAMLHAPDDVKLEELYSLCPFHRSHLPVLDHAPFPTPMPLMPASPGPPGLLYAPASPSPWRHNSRGW